MSGLFSAFQGKPNVLPPASSFPTQVDEGLCPCKCFCAPLVAITCCCSNRFSKLRCLECCRDINFDLYRIKKILSIVFAVPRALWKLFKYIVFFLGPLITALALFAVFIYLLRTFCSTVIDVINFFFGSGSIFPLRAYDSMMQTVYSSTGSYNDIVLIWNESAPNISAFVRDMLDMILELHQRIFESATTQVERELITINLASKLEILYTNAVDLFKLFLELDFYDLEVVSDNFKLVVNQFVIQRQPIQQCFMLYPSLAMQCALIGSVLGTNQTHNPIGRTLLEHQYPQSHIKPPAHFDARNITGNGGSRSPKLLGQTLRYFCSVDAISEQVALCDKLKSSSEKSFAKVLMGYLFDYIPQKHLSKYEYPGHALYTLEFQQFFHTLVNFGLFTDREHVLFRDERVSVDYYSWVKNKGSEGKVNLESAEQVIEFAEKHYRTYSSRSRGLLYIPGAGILSCFAQIPPDFLCIGQNLFPVPFTTSGLGTTIIDAIMAFTCDCSSLGYQDTLLAYALPFKNVWLILKTVISGIFSIPIFSTLISSIYIPPAIQTAFFIDTPGVPLTSQEVICAILHLDYAAVLLAELLIAAAILFAILDTICEIIIDTACLRLLREHRAIAEGDLILPKYVNYWEKVILDFRNREARALRAYQSKVVVTTAAVQSTESYTFQNEGIGNNAAGDQPTLESELESGPLNQPTTLSTDSETDNDTDSDRVNLGKGIKPMKIDDIDLWLSQLLDESLMGEKMNLGQEISLRSAVSQALLSDIKVGIAKSDFHRIRPSVFVGKLPPNPPDWCKRFALDDFLTHPVLYSGVAMKWFSRGVVTGRADKLL